MAPNSLFCADVPLSNYSLTQLKFWQHIFSVFQIDWFVACLGLNVSVSGVNEKFLLHTSKNTETPSALMKASFWRKWQTGQQGKS